MLAQLLELPDSTNSFIGRSPFERTSVKPSFAWFNRRIYIITERGGVDYYDLRKGELPAKIEAVWRAVSQTHVSELEDKIVEK
jgi:hypothetical protein